MAQILVDESLLGWKEYEMEVVRDTADNAIIVCSIENVDPMGVHTGDSITVAPALTLTDKEYQIMRNGSIAVLREIGVETGGSNVQWAINPDDGRMVVIEMNPRVSRSSALASKATGFPIAKIAAKLAVGYTLDELDNDITKVTPASFEPTIDYVVTKIPEIRLREIPGFRSLPDHGDEIRGRSHVHRPHHPRILQKALASMESGLTGFDEIEIPGPWARPDKAAVIKAHSQPADARPPAHHRAGHAPRAERRRHFQASPSSTRGSWPVSARSSMPKKRIRKDGLPVTKKACAQAQDAGLHRRAPGQADRPRSEDNVRRARRNLGVTRRVQTHRHLRRRVRGADALHVLDLRSPDDGRGGMRSAPLRPQERSSSWAAAPTGSVRASSSTIAAVTPASR